MFYGAPPKVLEYGTSRLPKCFTDGSNITVKYNHTNKESIEDFMRNIKIQLRPYPVYQWIALTRKQLGKSIELAIQEYEATLMHGRHNVVQTDGTIVPCPEGFYSWPEFEDWLVNKYHRPLREIRVIQRALFTIKQGERKSLEHYINEFNQLLNETTVVLPDILFKAIILYQMKQHTADILYKNKNIIKMSKADFILKATTLDDVEFTSKVGKSTPFVPKKTWADRKAQSAKDKAINAVRQADQGTSEVASIDRPVQTYKRDYLDPFSQEGLAFHKDKSKTICNFCKGAHWICKCPILWKRHRKGQDMPQDIKKNIVPGFVRAITVNKINIKTERRYYGGQWSYGWHTIPFTQNSSTQTNTHTIREN